MPDDVAVLGDGADGGCPPVISARRSPIGMLASPISLTQLRKIFVREQGRRLSEVVVGSRYHELVGCCLFLLFSLILLW